MTLSDETLLLELKQLDRQGVKFAAAKAQLLKKGYTDAQVSQAVYRLKYDAKPDAKPETHPHTEYFEKDPGAAAAVAHQLLKDEAEKNRGRAASSLLGSRFAPGPHARAHYEFKAFEELGLPYFTIFFLSIAWTIVVIAFQWPDQLAYAGIIAIPLLFFIKNKIWG